MLFFWIYSLASLMFLLIAKLFFVITIDMAPIIFGNLVLFFLPLSIRLIAFLRGDMQPSRPLWTTSGIIGILVALVFLLIGYIFLHISVGMLLFLAILFVGAYFSLESKIFFAGSLIGLVITILSLAVGLDSIAEQSSIIVYLLLVLGVAIELLAPIFSRIHKSSHHLLRISPQFVEAYRRDMEQYVRMISLVFGMLFTFLVISRGRWLRVDDAFYIYVSLGILAFFVFFLFLTKKPYTFDQFFHGESGLSLRLPRFLTQNRILWMESLIATALAAAGFIYGLPFVYIFGISLGVFGLTLLTVFALPSFLQYVNNK